MNEPAIPDAPPAAPAMELWQLWLPLLLGALAVYLLLPRPRNYPRPLGALAAAAAILSAGWLLVHSETVSVELVLFYIFAALAVSAGGMMLAQSNPVHAALSFAIVVLSSCGLFLLQAAPFLMAATIIVYAGAIVVTFLFVIMLAQQAGRSDADHRSREPLLATIAGFVLLGAILYLLHVNYDTSSIDRWLDRIHAAAEAPTNAEMIAMVAPEDDSGYNLFDQLEPIKTQPRLGYYNPPEFKDRVGVETARNDWEEAKFKQDLPGMRKALLKLEDEVRTEVRDQYGSMKPSPRARPLSTMSGGANGLEQREAGDPAPGKLPVENPAYLGRTLFTDFLIGVEIAGFLLLVAAIGAIAITHRRAEDVR